MENDMKKFLTLSIMLSNLFNINCFESYEKTKLNNDGTIACSKDEHCSPIISNFCPEKLGCPYRKCIKNRCNTCYSKGKCSVEKAW